MAKRTYTEIVATVAELVRAGCSMHEIMAATGFRLRTVERLVAAIETGGR